MLCGSKRCRFNFGSSKRFLGLAFRWCLFLRNFNPFTPIAAHTGPKQRQPNYPNEVLALSKLRFLEISEKLLLCLTEYYE